MENGNYQGALQSPISSGFGASSTAHEVLQGINLQGKTAIVTGGYAGLGLETTKGLAGAGASVIVPARDIEKAKQNLGAIAGVVVVAMDLMDPLSINTFAENFLESGKPLHLLINNAGIMWVPLQRDSRGYESQLSTNHLGHFHLTAKLWPALKNANGARVVNVSSWGHHFSPFVFEDPNFENREYETLLGYGQSKTANILFSLELDRRAKDFGVRSYSVHPGAIVESELGRHLTKEELTKFGLYDAQGNVVHDASKGLKTLQQGASTQVWCATSPQLNSLGGVYCENTEIAQLDVQDDQQGDVSERMNNSYRIAGVMPYALDAEAAGKLWTMSEDLTDVKFDVS